MDRFESMQNMIDVEALTKTGKKFEQIAMETNWLTRNNIKPAALDGTIPAGELKTREEVTARIKKDMTAFMAESMRSSSTKDAIMSTIHDITKYYAKNAGAADQYKQFTKKDALRAFKIDEEATKWSYKIVFSNTDDKYINMGISQYVWEYVVRKFRPHFMNYLGSISVTKSGRAAINFRIKLKDAKDNAMEGLFGWGKKKAMVEPPEQKAQIAALNERYGKQMLALAKEIGNDFDRRMHGNKAFVDNYTLEANDKDALSPISKKGNIDIVVVHWQGVCDAIAELNNLDSFDDNDDIAERYSKMVNLDYYLRKYESKAKAIHPSCQVKKMEDDIDLLYLHIDPTAITK